MQLELAHIPEILAALNRVLHQSVDAGLPYNPDQLHSAVRDFAMQVCTEKPDADCKTSRLSNVGLKSNPCQGCEAYYPASPPATVCALELVGGCEWIRLHDEALRG